MVQTRNQKRLESVQEGTKQLIITLRYRPAGSVQQVSSKKVQPTKKILKKFVKRRSRSLKVKLSSIDYSRLPAYIQQLDYKNIRALKRQENYSGRYLPPLKNQHNNRYAFVFGHNPFRHTNFQGPTAEQQWNVYNLMKKDLKDNFNKDCFLDQPDATTNELQDGPMHMSEDLSVDNLIKVILSISTENSLAIRQHAQLCSLFTYTVSGNEVKGHIPNYHKMRVCAPEELVRALNIAGYQNMRQKAFHAILSEIHTQNVKRMERWEIMPEGNAIGAADFVPGLLSMEYLKGDGLSKQERFDLLVKYDQIAVKTGCCLLAFNLKIPVFVVDTHVHNMARNLGWIPEHCYDADKACMFLDKIMPEHLKFGLHQAFWHHRINCARCMPRANPKSLVYQQRICPLEHLVKRDLPPLNRGAAQGNKDKGEAKPRRKSSTPKEKKQAGSVTFLNIHYKVASEQGYVLRRVEIDDNFGDGSRQNKGDKADYYWGQKQFTHVDDVVKIEDALYAMGMSTEEYEARFVKKVRTKKQKKITKKEPTEDMEQESDVDMDEGIEEDDDDNNVNEGNDHNGDDSDDSSLTDIDEIMADQDIDMADEA